MSTLLACLLGLVSGVRHAIEPDHVAAVSTLVAEQRSGRASFRFAAMWGMGHALMLLCIGGTLLALRKAMPSSLEQSFEIGVAVMLVVLGARAIRESAKATGPRAPHAHGGEAHTHAGAAKAHVHVWGRSLLVRPMLIGVVHGLAGSGSLAAIAVARAPSAGMGLVLLALYGAGAALGMSVLAGLAGAPLAKLVESHRARRVLLSGVGALSLVMGLAWGVLALMRMREGS